MTYTSFSSAEQAALADLAPIRPTPLPIEILAAGGPRALRELRKGMVRTKHGWARPCSACGSTTFGRPCRVSEDGFHV